MTKKRILALACALALLLGLMPAAWAAGSAFFSDVRPGDWFYSYVTELAQMGGVSGYEDGTFRPNSQIKLVEAAAMALGALPPADGENFILSYAERVNGASYWGNRTIAAANALGITGFGWSRDRWERPATRAELAWLMFHLYAAHTGQTPVVRDEASKLVGDYQDAVSKSIYRRAILWLYSEGIVAGMNENGDYVPDSASTRAQTSTMLLALLHPERWTKVDWAALQAQTKAVRLEDGTDFTGKARTHYDLDTAYDFCRALEKQIGIQIFYLPEWTEKEAGFLQHSDMDFLKDGPDEDYFRLVLGELKKMKEAFDQYPKGLLKEMVRRKAPRGAEIILCPYTIQGYAHYGVHVYDYSDDSKKIDQIYYTGTGDSQYYSHEMGHMVLSTAGVLSGWNDVVSRWDALSTSDADYISDYARTNREEDWAETWAFLWHDPAAVSAQIAAGGQGLRGKVEMIAWLLSENYGVSEDQLPWLSVLK